MEYRQLGESGVSASVITFGAWAIGGWMWGGSERSDAVAAIRASYDEGVTSIDTAAVYGQGLSEEIVGEALQGIPRDRVQVMTKFGMRWDLARGDFAFKSQDNAGRPLDIYKYGGRESIIKECEDSLRRLRTDYIDVYQQHWPDVTTPIAETMEALAELQKAGKIRAAGVSNYDVAQMREAEKTIRLASDQVPYSMVRRDIEKELVPYCLEHKKAILAYSPLQRGLLSGKIRPGHRFNEGDNRGDSKYYQGESLNRINAFLDQLRPLAEAKGSTLAQLVIRWTIQRPGITIALVGARDAAQAVQNARASRVELTAEEIAFIDNTLAALKLD
ncbi:MAG TPA: aldo/keto reductase [Puia sp.]|uniref:aldo/keto reductase n=1 Tax=Puia sp. TaxID=2045100 RepID=UPI002C8EE3EF|nr:aldo/keto reductase [Puia sp.]HVU95899.1 aldo/keto reductase [Puia sp.]